MDKKKHSTLLERIYMSNLSAESYESEAVKLEFQPLDVSFYSRRTFELWELYQQINEFFLIASNGDNYFQC